MDINFIFEKIGSLTGQLYDALNLKQWGVAEDIRKEIEKASEILTIIKSVGPAGRSIKNDIYHTTLDTVKSLATETQEDIQRDIEAVDGAVKGEMAKGVVDAATKLNKEFDTFE